MKIALCDDDERELTNIRSLLDSYQKTRNISLTYQEYHSSCELALRASKERFDIYLLYGKGHQLSDEAGILQRFLCCHG